jgi:hypothetical protein
MGHLPTVEKGPGEITGSCRDETVQRNLSRVLPASRLPVISPGTQCQGVSLIPGPARAIRAWAQARWVWERCPEAPWVDVRQCQGSRRSASGARVTPDISAPLAPGSVLKPPRLAR